MNEDEARTLADRAERIAKRYAHEVGALYRGRVMADLIPILDTMKNEIREQALEEAARIAESIDTWERFDGDFEANQIAAAIRAAK